MGLEIPKPITFYTGLVLFVVGFGIGVNGDEGRKPGSTSWLEARIAEGDTVTNIQSLAGIVMLAVGAWFMTTARITFKKKDGRGPGGPPSVA